MADEPPEVFANGIDAATGTYLVPPLTSAEVADALKNQDGDDSQHLAVLTRVEEARTSEHYGLPFGVDPTNIAVAGWAVVFHKDESADTKAAFEPLIRARRDFIKDPSRVKVLEYRPGESRAQFLAKYGIGAGTVDPTRVPYYLLIVGTADRIPFTFTRELGVEYAVGVLDLDTKEEYERYVSGLVAYEKGAAAPRGKKLTWFATRHSFDAATQMSADKLVKPLSTPGDAKSVTDQMGFRADSFSGPDAKRDALLTALSHPNESDRPAILFTATHGMGFPSGSAAQQAEQGALLCQDWAGMGSGPVQRAQYFAAADVTDTAHIHGLVGFHFACFGGGTPAADRFSHRPGTAPPKLAAAPFYASLPKRLLSHPNGGALGCIAHVERAWGTSIVMPGAGLQLLPFSNALCRIMAGQPLGLALKDFNERYAAISVSLSGMLEQAGYGATIPDAVLVNTWLQRNDAEGFMLIGDPAARVRVEELR